MPDRMSEDQKPDDAKRDATPEERFAASEADAPVKSVQESTTSNHKVYAQKPGGRDKTPSAASETGEIFKTIIFALLIAMVLRIFLFQPFTIPSASMEPTLLEGDYIIVSKYAYGWSRHSIPFSPPIFNGRIAAQQPQRGDVVVFKLPRDGRTDYIKRLIGLPGDKIQVIQGQVQINGQPVARTEISPEAIESAFGTPRERQRYTNTLGKHDFITYSLDPGSDVENTPVYTVPAGNYFMMGDNRDNSQDSRYWGFVPDANIVGKAFFVWMNFGDLKRIGAFR
jgi:signal peptidase I